MRMSIPRRLLVLGVSVPTLIVGGLLSAGASNAAPASPSGAAAAGAVVRAKAPLPKTCRDAKVRFSERKNIWGRKGKLIGHVSLYRGPGGAVCVITWRNGVARGNRNLTRVRIDFGTGNIETYSARSKVRSAPFSACPVFTFNWWGDLKYKGTWYKSRRGIG